MVIKTGWSKCSNIWCKLVTPVRHTRTVTAKVGPTKIVNKRNLKQHRHNPNNHESKYWSKNIVVNSMLWGLNIITSHWACRKLTQSLPHGDMTSVQVPRPRGLLQKGDARQGIEELVQATLAQLCYLMEQQPGEHPTSAGEAGEFDSKNIGITSDHSDHSLADSSGLSWGRRLH